MGAIWNDTFVFLLLLNIIPQSAILTNVGYYILELNYFLHFMHGFSGVWKNLTYFLITLDLHKNKTKFEILYWNLFNFFNEKSTYFNMF